MKTVIEAKAKQKMKPERSGLRERLHRMTSFKRHNKAGCDY